MTEDEQDRHDLTAVVQQDATALRRLHGRHAERVYNLALGYLQSAEDAEEVTQDVFATIWRKAGTFGGKSRVTTWVYRIAANASLTTLRKRKRRAIFQPWDAATGREPFVHPGVAEPDRERHGALYAAIGRLPARQKTAFILCYQEGLPRERVAEIMRLTRKAVEGLLMRAKTKLREDLPPDFLTRD